MESHILNLTDEDLYLKTQTSHISLLALFSCVALHLLVVHLQVRSKRLALEFSTAFYKCTWLYRGSQCLLLQWY